MFEEYLEDSSYFAEKASKADGEREAKRYYRAAVFCVMSAVEAFVNYIGDLLVQGDILQPYEAAFLTDRKFDLSAGRFQILEQMEYHRLEDKLKFLICKFVPDFDFDRTPCWSRLIDFKKFRDNIVHPRQEEDEIEIAEYSKRMEIGLTSAIQVMDHLCVGMFGRHVRKKILDLSL